MTNLVFDGFTFHMDKRMIQDSLLIVVSGSHAYGWVTPKSDLDVRCVFFPCLHQALSIFHRAITKQWQTQSKRGLVEVTDYPIANFIGLLAKGNGNALDNLFQAETSTSIHARTKEVTELKQLTLEYLHNGFLNHCIGYDTSLLNDMTNQTRLKRCGPQKLALCRYKILLEGIILANYRKVCYNLSEQSTFVQTKYCLPLLSDYVTGKQTDLSVIREELDQLRKQLIDITENVKLWAHGKESPLDQALEHWYLEYYAPSPKQSSTNAKKQSLR